ncbi:MFS transporter [Sorangium sp. So ce1024]|uniref:MFS transporter n=1 Tax=unclassified Sorangium TaxID=2621164 RepID=UPI003F03516D
MPSPPRDGLSRNPDFLRLWAAQAVSALGGRVSRTALPVIAIVSLGADAAGVATLSALSTAPGVLVGLFAGGLVDRSRKRPLLIGADLVRAALILSVPIAAWTGVLTLVQLFAVAALAGMATSLFQIADNAYLPALVGQDRLVEANARIEGTEAAAEIAGPGAAGILIQVLTAPVTMVVDALSYLGSAALLGRIRATHDPRGERPTVHAAPDGARPGQRHAPRDHGRAAAGGHPGGRVARGPHRRGGDGVGRRARGPRRAAPAAAPRGVAAARGLSARGSAGSRVSFSSRTRLTDARRHGRPQRWAPIGVDRR